MEHKELSLVEVTKENWYKVCRLSDTLSSDHRKCVADNSYSLAQANFYSNAWYRAIACGDELIGFVMLNTDYPPQNEADYPCGYLWRFMIGGPWQKKGYGKQTLDMLCDRFRQEGLRYVYTSCDMKEYGPYGFYRKYGFVVMEYDDDGEEVLKLTL